MTPVVVISFIVAVGEFYVLFTVVLEELTEPNSAANLQSTFKLSKNDRFAEF
jgi:hypothetical protein